MLEKIRNNLEKTATVLRIEDRAKALDAALRHINEIIEDEDLCDKDRKILENMVNSHCRQFLVRLKEYGNSGYSEVVPLFNLITNNIKTFGEIVQKDPDLADELSRFFACVNDGKS